MSKSMPTANNPRRPARPAQGRAPVAVKTGKKVNIAPPAFPARGAKLNTSKGPKSKKLVPST